MACLSSFWSTSGHLALMAVWLIISTAVLLGSTGEVMVAAQPVEKAPVVNGRGFAGWVALTFDDGPHLHTTPAILKVLNQYKFAPLSICSLFLANVRFLLMSSLAACLGHSLLWERI